MKTFLKSLFWGNFLVIFAFWLQGSASLFSYDFTSITLAIGRIFGLLTVYLVLVQLLLIGRIWFIEQNFGHDKLARIHHKVGRFIILLLILHVILMIYSYSSFASVGFFAQAFVFFTSIFDLTKAFFAFALFGLIAITSIWMKRLKLKYEYWYYIHLMVYAAILLAFGHQTELGGDFINDTFVLYWYALYTIVFLSFVVFRFGRVLYYFAKHQFRVAKIVSETQNVTSIYITGKKIDQFPVHPGQFMIFRFLDNIRFWQAHPFSLSWVVQDNMLRISVKNSGDFTSQIAKIKPGTKILVDGPLGVFTSKFASKNKFLFIAGGIGITPIRALVEELSGDNRDIILLYSNKTKNDIVFGKELSKFDIKIHNFLTEEKGKENFISGRIAMENIKKLVPDLAAREVYVCGPQEFMTDIIDILIQLKIPKNQIHFEKFSLH